MDARATHDATAPLIMRRNCAWAGLRRRFLFLLFLLLILLVCFRSSSTGTVSSSRPKRLATCEKTCASSSSLSIVVNVAVVVIVVIVIVVVVVIVAAVVVVVVVVSLDLRVLVFQGTVAVALSQQRCTGAGVCVHFPCCAVWHWLLACRWPHVCRRGVLPWWTCGCVGDRAGG
jgi:hypothetical protein